MWVSGGILDWDEVEYEGRFRTPTPFERTSTETCAVEATNPTDEILDGLIRISIFVPYAEVKVACAESWNERAVPTVVDEIFADKNAINLRVVTQVSHVDLAALVAMFGGRLTPPVRGLVAMVDVVAETVFEGCPLIRAFVQKTGDRPTILVTGQTGTVRPAPPLQQGTRGRLFRRGLSQVQHPQQSQPG